MSITIKKLLGYGLFLVVVGCFFLYAFFPSDTLHQYIEASVVKISPELSLDIGTIRPALPFGIALEDARLHHESEPGIPVFRGETVTVSPSFRTFVEGKPIVHFSCDSYGGTFDGEVVFRTFALNRPFKSELQISGVRLEQYEMLRERLKRRCTGVISGRITYAFDKRHLLDGSGEAEFAISNGTVRFSQPFFGLETLDFDQIDARMGIKDRRVVFDEISFRGTKLNGRGNGTMHLEETFGRSRLDVRVEVEPMPALWDTGHNGFNVAQLLKRQTGAAPFTIRIYGPVRQPRFTLP